MPDDDASADAARAARRLRVRRALSAFVVSVVVLVAALAELAVNGWSLFAGPSSPPMREDVRVRVDPDSRAIYGGKSYGLDEAHDLLAAIARDHPGAGVSVCLNPDSRWGGNLTYEGARARLDVAYVFDPTNPLCKP